jgi:cell division transport system permease protein
MPIATPELDLPLADAPAGRFLTWTMAALTGSAVLAFALAAAADVAIRRAALEPRLVTVALPAATDEAAAGRAVEILRAYPGVAYAAPVAREEVGRLVEPWLGSGGAAGRGGGGRRGGPAAAAPDRRRPQPRRRRGRGRLARELAEVAPDARVADEGAPAGDGGLGAAGLLRLAAGGAGLLLLGAMVAVTAVVTRVCLDLHGDSVDLLRLMGARDGYVARQFEQQALASGLKGRAGRVLRRPRAVLAAVLAAALLPRLGLPGLDLRASDWVLLGCVPVLGALLTALVARLAALHGLARLR